MAEDPCPTRPQSAIDTDGDGIPDDCDPNPRWRNTFVGGGTASQPPASANTLLGPWVDDHGNSCGPRAGFLDTDRDGLVDGEDYWLLR